MDDVHFSEPESSASPSLCPPRLFLMQSGTMAPDEDSLECTGNTPIPKAQTTLTLPSRGHELEESPLSLESVIKGHTPMTADEDATAPIDGYCFTTPAVSDDDQNDDEELKESEAESSDDDDYSEYDSDDSSISSDIPMTMLLSMMSDAEEDTVFAENGYKKVRKICDSLQGEVFQCEIFRETEHNKHIGAGHLVAVKRIWKKLDAENVAEQDDMTLLVDEDVKKEAMILKHLTVDNDSIARDLVKFVQFFESEEHLYLVTEYVDGCALSEFVTAAHDYLRSGKLSRDEYTECIKSIMWQLVHTVKWLHKTMKCVHMDLCCDNVMVTGVHFVPQTVDEDDEESKENEYSVRLEGKVAIKLIDFGVAEIFDTPRNRRDKDFNFECIKDGNELNVERAANHAPESSIGCIFDARGSDIWSLGMILYESMVGAPLYEAQDIWNSKFHHEKNGYWAIQKSKLKDYLESEGLMEFFSEHSFSLLESLLNVNPGRRFTSNEAEKHVWFKGFYRRNFYAAKMRKRHKQWQSEQERNQFPYYSI